MKPNKRVKDVTGQVFGRLTVLEYIGTDYTKDHKLAKWRCLCSCGNEFTSTVSNLINGNTKSCGCFRKESASINHVLPTVKSSLNKLYTNYKNGAKKRELDFDIPLDVFTRLTSLNCFYCGIEPSTIHRGRRFSKSDRGDHLYNGLDRVDSSKGYTYDNVVPCCKKCNYAKRQMSYKDFKNWIFTVSDHLLSKNILSGGIKN